MKSVIFEVSQANISLHELRLTVIKFLNTHSSGFGHYMQDFVSVQGEGIVVNAKCSNSDYTRALSLLQLIFSDHNSPGFISYAPEYSFRLNRGNSSITNAQLVNHINNHLNVTIN